MELEEEIKYLISLKKEGSYWDFKREWYNKQQKDALLHDIICFANNLVDRDCYIIIGVDEEKDFAINDLSTDLNRRNTQNLVNFLSNKDFAGGIRPKVIVETIIIDNKSLDIIIIKNSNDTPFYLTKHYKEVSQYYIYTRVLDTNTSKIESADINNIEYLWKKRFGLLKTPIQKIELYLQNPDNWLSSPLAEQEEQYYQYDPAYRFIIKQDESRNGYEFYLFSQIDPYPHWKNLYMYYQQTVIDSYLIMAMDGGGWYAPTPEHAFIDDIFESKIDYRYYIVGTIRHKLLNFFNGAEEDPYGYKKFISLVLIFENNEEKTMFEKYVLCKLDDFNDLLAKQESPYMEDLPNYDMSFFKDQYKKGIVLNKMLQDFRNNKKS